MTNNEIVKSQEVLVEVFNFSQEKTPIRVKMVDNEPWFVATDVCQVLKIANNRNAVARLDDDEKKDGVRIMDTVGRTNYVTMINESGLYAIILQSRKPNAQAVSQMGDRRSVAKHSQERLLWHPQGKDRLFGCERHTIRACGIQRLQHQNH